MKFSCGLLLAACAISFHANQAFSQIEKEARHLEGPVLDAWTQVSGGKTKIRCDRFAYHTGTYDGSLKQKDPKDLVEYGLYKQILVIKDKDDPFGKYVGTRYFENRVKSVEVSPPKCAIAPHINSSDITSKPNKFEGSLGLGYKAQVEIFDADERKLNPGNAKPHNV